MEYLVMECNPSYAIVLDSEGRFLKVPNLCYEVGQTLDHVVLMDAPSRHRPLRKDLTRWAAMAACLCIMVIGSWRFWQSPIGTVRMQINPDVQMSVNRFDRVIDLEGLNTDGEDLVRGYRVYGKSIQTASDELADRAMDLGYLSDGGRITLTVESDRENWKTATEELLLLELDAHFEHRIIVETAAADTSDLSEETAKDMIVIWPGEILQEQMHDDDFDDLNDRDDDDFDDFDDRDDDDLDHLDDRNDNGHDDVDDRDDDGFDDLDDRDDYDLDDARDDDRSDDAQDDDNNGWSEGVFSLENEADDHDDSDDSDDGDLDDAHSDSDDEGEKD